MHISIFISICIYIFISITFQLGFQFTLQFPFQFTFRFTFAFSFQCTFQFTVCFETDMVPNAFRQIPLSSVAWLTIYFLQHPVPKMCPFKYTQEWAFVLAVVVSSFFLSVVFRAIGFCAALRSDWCIEFLLTSWQPTYMSMRRRSVRAACSHDMGWSHHQRCKSLT